MAKAFEPPKAIKLPSGGRLRLGMIIGGTDMMNQRPLNQPYNIARDGAPTRTTVAQPVPGQKRQTSGEPAAYHHGVTVDDMPRTIKTFTGKMPIHPGMTDAQKAKVHPVANAPKVILADAANLGKPEKA
jgi:hypothetical protein